MPGPAPRPSWPLPVAAESRLCKKPHLLVSPPGLRPERSALSNAEAAQPQDSSAAFLPAPAALACHPLLWSSRPGPSPGTTVRSRATAASRLVARPRCPALRGDRGARTERRQGARQAWPGLPRRPGPSPASALIRRLVCTRAMADTGRAPGGEGTGRVVGVPRCPGRALFGSHGSRGWLGPRGPTGSWNVLLTRPGNPPRKRGAASARGVPGTWRVGDGAAPAAGPVGRRGAGTSAALRGEPTRPPASHGAAPTGGRGSGTAGDRRGALLGRGGLTPAGRRPRYKSCGASSRVLCARRRLPWWVGSLHSPAAPFPSACAGPALRSCSRGRCAA